MKLLENLPFGWSLYWIETTPSTMDEVRQKALEGAEEGLVILAEEQTAGRGRRGRSWWGARGKSLLFSFLLRQKWPLNQIGLLGGAFGVAVAEALSSYTSTPVGIKWPNDLILEGKKLGGILIEGPLSGSFLEWAVVGIGLNWAMTLDDFPPEIRDQAISLSDKARVLPDRFPLLKQIVEKIYDYYLIVKDHPESILRKWREKEVTLGKEIWVQREEGWKEQGIALDITDQGGLLWKGPRGPETLLWGEVTLGE